MGFLIFVVVIGLLIAVFVGIYNSLIKLRNMSEQSWSDIDVQLKRRYDLVPNLVETVRGYASHEKDTFEKVVQARNAAMQASSPGDKAQAENILQSTLKSLFALAESYPDLKANQNVAKLMEELTGTENKISFARQFYNDSVNSLNDSVQTFPSNIIAGMFGFKMGTYFEVPEAEKATPKVDLR